MQIDSCIQAVCDDIVRQFSPKKIILFNVKNSPGGETRSFKLCVVLETDDIELTEKRIYLDIDSEVPFDVLVYTPREWEKLMLEKNSFANRITREGRYIYGS